MALARVGALVLLALGTLIFSASLVWREWVRLGVRALEGAAPHAARAAKHAAPGHDALEVALLVALAVVVALREELVYRAWLVTRLEQVLASPWSAVLLGARVFSLAHYGQGAYGVSRTLISGAIYGASLVLTGRFWPGVVAHALNDAWAFLR